MTLGAELISSGRLAAIGVPHGFTTRRGGSSTGMFDSLNLGNPSDLAAEERDPRERILANWSLVMEPTGAAGRELVEVHQVHGAAVHVVRRGAATHPALPVGTSTKADAIVSDDPGRLLAVRVADCAPVLLANADGVIVAAVHAGWRGVVAKVTTAAVAAMRGLGAREIVGAIGPCLGGGGRGFEVGMEVAEQFRSAFGTAAAEFVVERGDGKAMVDVQAALVCELLECGVAGVDVCARCTAQEAGAFFSHRREKGRTGRMAGVIGVRGR